MSCIPSDTVSDFIFNYFYCAGQVQNFETVERKCSFQ